MARHVFNPGYLLLNMVVSLISYDFFIVPIIDGDFPHMSEDMKALVEKCLPYKHGAVDMVFVPGNCNQRILFFDWPSEPSVAHWKWLYESLNGLWWRKHMVYKRVMFFPPTRDKKLWSLYGAILANAWNLSNIDLTIVIPEDWAQISVQPSGKLSIIGIDE